MKSFGFKPKYNEDTGRINAFEKVTKGRGLCITKDKKRIRIFEQRAEWKVNPYNGYFDVDTLYDLIIADMVVKE